MRRLIEWAVNNSPTMNSLMVAILVVGIGSTALLQREEFPQFSLDRVIVSVPYPGATSEQVEEGICQKVEEAIQTIDGISKVLSVSSEGVGVITATLATNVKDPQRVVNDIRSAVDRIPSFPELAEKPEVQEIIIRSPAIQVAVIGPERTDEAAEWQLRQLSERIRDDMLQLPDVSQVTVLASRPYQIDVEISEDTLRKYGLTLGDVAAAIRRENVELPAGLMRTENSELLLRGSNRQLYGSEIAKFPVITQTNGAVLTVADLGVVRDGFEDVSTYSYINGRPAVSLQVDRAESEDLLAITDQIRDYVAYQKELMPEGYELIYWFDQSVEVWGRLNLLITSGIFGLTLVFLILSLFLNIRLAFWVALGIPISIFGACAVLYWRGETINQLSMFAFVMGLGIVVDDAIVVGENVFSHRQRGKSRFRAAIDGTLEVAPAVTASVLTTVIAFMPMFFVAGLMGKFIAVMPLAIIAMLLVSLFESLFILPCHLAHTHFKPSTSLYGRLRSSVDRGIFWVINDLYVPALAWLLKHPATAFAGSVASLLVTFGLIAGGFTPFVLAPQVDGDVIMCNLAFPAGTPVQRTEEASRQIEQALLTLGEEYDGKEQPILHNVFRAVGTMFEQDPTRGGSNSGGNMAFFLVELVPAAERPYASSSEVIARWRAAVGEIPGTETLQFEGINIGPGGKPIEFKVLGNDLDELQLAVNDIKQQLNSYAGVYDIADGNNVGKWEIRLKNKPRARALGVSLEEAASTVRSSYYGEEVMRLQRGRHEVKLMVRYPEEQRRSLARFEEIRVRKGDREIPLPELVDRELEREPSQIVRVDQKRAITVTANINEGTANAANIVADLKASFLPDLFLKYPGIAVRWEGQAEQTQESMQSLAVGFAVALFGIYLLLTALFRSYVQPLMIMIVIPFGLIGTVLGHLVLGMPLTLFTMFGVVALSGVAINDSIVLIDFINQRRREGMELVESLLDAGKQRFRPILLTSLTTIAGLLPILVERSLQAQLLIPMAAAIAFGLAMATFWILLLVPVLYQFYAKHIESDEDEDQLPPEFLAQQAADAENREQHKAELVAQSVTATPQLEPAVATAIATEDPPQAEGDTGSSNA